MTDAAGIVDDKVVHCDEHTSPIPLRRAYDRRKNGRRCFETPVRYLTADGGEFEGVLQDISPTGIRIAALAPPARNAHIVLYIDKIGRFEGRVVRTGEREFALEMTMSLAKLVRLEEAINLFFQTEADDAAISDRRDEISDRRRHDRRAVDIDAIDGVTEDGVRFSCQIANLSLSGAEIITDADFCIGQKLKIGNVRGEITRMTQLGYAVKRVAK